MPALGRLMAPGSPVEKRETGEEEAQERNPGPLVWDSLLREVVRGRDRSRVRESSAQPCGVSSHVSPGEVSPFYFSVITSSSCCIR